MPARVSFVVTIVLMTAFLIAVAAPAKAVILAGGNSTSGTDPSTAPPGYASVGSLTDPTGAAFFGSAVYLGNRYVLIAAHENPNAVTFNNGATIFNPVAGSAVQLHNSDNTPADLTVYRIDGDPGVPAVTVAATPPPVGSPVDMIGYGLNRATDTPVTVTGPNGFSMPGYYWATTNTKRYGTNTTRDFNDYNMPGSPDQGYITTLDEPGTNVKTLVLTTGFTQSNPNDAEATAGDSGGGVFNPGTNQLVGLIDSVDTFTNQPNNSSVFGEYTFSADVAAYRDQIEAIIPEPAALPLVMFAVTPWLLRGRRR